MASDYPGGLDSFPTNRANSTPSTTTHPGDHNNLADAVNKIEATLGVNPQGDFDTVVARLDGGSQPGGDALGVIRLLSGGGPLGGDVPDSALHGESPGTPVLICNSATQRNGYYIADTNGDLQIAPGWEDGKIVPEGQLFASGEGVTYFSDDGLHRINLGSYTVASTTSVAILGTDQLSVVVDADPSWIGEIDQEIVTLVSAITAVHQSGNYFTVADALPGLYFPSRAIVSGSTGNDGAYWVTQTQAPDRVTVDPSIPDATADGTLTLYAPVQVLYPKPLFIQNFDPLVAGAIWNNNGVLAISAGVS